MPDRATVLIADDEVNLCRVLRAELEKAGYAVTCVHDGADAVAEAEKQEYSAIILDIRMPTVDGLSALKQIRSIRRDTPVIVMTAYESHDTASDALFMGASVCLNKPFDLEGLLGLIRALMQEKNTRKPHDGQIPVHSVVFETNQSVFVELGEGPNAGSYWSTLDSKDDRSIAISCLSADGRFILPGLGTRLMVGFAGEDGFYSFETIVLSYREGLLPSIVVGKPAVIYRNQRRKYPRVQVRVPVELMVDDRDGTSLYFRLFTEDLSAGGFRTLCTRELPDGKDVNVRSMCVPGMDPFTCTGRITHTRRVEADGTPQWEHGISFTKLDPEVHSRLSDVIV